MTPVNIMQAIAVNIPTTLTLTVTHEQFFELAQANQDLQLERNATVELILMPAKGSKTGTKNLDMEGQLWLWKCWIILLFCQVKMSYLGLF